MQLFMLYYTVFNFNYVPLQVMSQFTMSYAATTQYPLYEVSIDKIWGIVGKNHAGTVVL